MKRGLLILVCSLLFSAQSFASSLNLNVKIAQFVGNKLIQVDKTISAEYDKEIIIKPEGFKNKIVFSLKKFSNVLVNGKKINPVQIDMKVVNEMQKIIGKPQTVTSFYNRSAEFAVTPLGEEDLNVSLNFEEN